LFAHNYWVGRKFYHRFHQGFLVFSSNSGTVWPVNTW
jgi:hypothetical protein